jgi:hypothetical protein
LPAEPRDQQIAKIVSDGLGHGCFYPTPEVLIQLGAGNSFADRPFSKELAEGRAQLEFRTFDLRVLEFYRNDPRFRYEVDEVFGSIYRTPDHREMTPATTGDAIELVRFGFAYDGQMNRAVAAFLRDLHGLAGEHQRHLKAFEVTGSYKLHPGFYKSMVLGDWPDRVPIYQAFLEEKKIINEIARLMGKEPLFRSEQVNPRPHGFGILLRPTRKEFRDFALALDQLLSDDISAKFFEGDIPTTETATMDDGTKRTLPVGTITLLGRWLKKHFRPGDPDMVPDLLKNLRSVRDERMKPAHVVEDNVFDQQYLEQQRELISKAYDAVRDLRMMLENHPAARGINVPDYLRDGKVWTF